MSDLIDRLRPVADIVAEYDHSVEQAEHRALDRLLALGMTPLAAESLMLVAADDAAPVALPAVALEAAPVPSRIPERPAAAPGGYICPKCHRPGVRHHYFNVCESCNQAAIDHRNARAKATREANASAQKSQTATKPAVELAPAPVETATETEPEHPAIPAPRKHTVEESSEALTIAISDGKRKYATVRRFDIYRENATGMYFPRGIGRYGQLEGMRPVLRLQQLGTGEWQETPLTAIGTEVGS